MDIRVQLSRDENINRWGTGTRVLDIEEYLRAVVPAEMSSSEGIEALKAQAIASRTYAYYRVWKNPNASFHVTDTPAYQSVRASKISTQSDSAVSSTNGVILKYNNQPIDTMFSASNGKRTKSGQTYGDHHDFLLERPDDWDYGSKTLQDASHKVGMCQYGAYAMASAGWGANKILGFYYFRTWRHTDYGSGNGMLLGSYLGQSGAVQLSDTTSTVNIRNQPSTSGGVVATLRHGAAFTVYDERASTDGFAWFKVNSSMTSPQWLRWDFTNFDRKTGSGGGSGSGYSTWQDKYGNNTFVISSSYSGNVNRFQVDMNKWRQARGYALISENGLWKTADETATHIFQQAYSTELAADGKCGPATKSKMFTLHG